MGIDLSIFFNLTFIYAAFSIAIGIAMLWMPKNFRELLITFFAVTGLMLLIVALPYPDMELWLGFVIIVSPAIGLLILAYLLFRKPELLNIAAILGLFGFVAMALIELDFGGWFKDPYFYVTTLFFLQMLTIPLAIWALLKRNRVPRLFAISCILLNLPLLGVFVY